MIKNRTPSGHRSSKGREVSRGHVASGEESWSHAPLPNSTCRRFITESTALKEKLSSRKAICIWSLGPGMPGNTVDLDMVSEGHRNFWKGMLRTQCQHSCFWSRYSRRAARGWHSCSSLGPGNRKSNSGSIGYSSISFNNSHSLASNQTTAFQQLGDSCRKKRKILAVMFHICCQEAKLCSACITMDRMCGSLTSGWPSCAAQEPALLLSNHLNTSL